MEISWPLNFDQKLSMLWYIPLVNNIMWSEHVPKTLEVLFYCILLCCIEMHNIVFDYIVREFLKIVIVQADINKLKRNMVFNIPDSYSFDKICLETWCLHFVCNQFWSVINAFLTIILTLVGPERFQKHLN